MTNKEAVEIMEYQRKMVCACCLHPQEYDYCDKYCKVQKAYYMAIDSLFPSHAGRGESEGEDDEYKSSN